MKGHISSLTFSDHFLKCHYDENRILSMETILKHKQIACMRKKNGVYHFQISQLYSAILNQILIKYDEKGYLSHFESEMFDSFQ